MAKTDEIRTQEMSKQVAIRMQEILMDEENFANSLYQYTGPAIINENGMIRPGDYLVCDDNGITTARGVQIDLTPEEIVKYEADGFITNVMQATGMSTEQISGNIDNITKVMYMQAEYNDAPMYFYNQEHDAYFAVYDDPATEKVMGAVQINASDNGSTQFINRDHMESNNVFMNAVECGFELYGTAMATVRGEAMKGVTNAFISDRKDMQKTKEEMRDLANADFEDIRKNKNMSATDKLQQIKNEQDKAEQERKQAEAIKPEEDFSPLAQSKAMKRFQ